MECDLQMHPPIPDGPAMAANACGGPRKALGFGGSSPSLILGSGDICALDGVCQASFRVSVAGVGGWGETMLGYLR